MIHDTDPTMLAPCCPTCGQPLFAAEASRLLDLVLPLYEDLGTAYAALAQAKARLEAEVMP